MKLKITATRKDRLARRARVDQLLDMEPEQIETWVDSNVNNLAQAKLAIARLAVLVAAALREARR
jgi:hypothetical protein